MLVVLPDKVPSGKRVVLPKRKERWNRLSKALQNIRAGDCDTSDSDSGHDSDSSSSSSDSDSDRSSSSGSSDSDSDSEDSEESEDDATQCTKRLHKSALSVEWKHVAGVYFGCPSVIQRCSLPVKAVPDAVLDHLEHTLQNKRSRHVSANHMTFVAPVVAQLLQTHQDCRLSFYQWLYGFRVPAAAHFDLIVRRRDQYALCVVHARNGSMEQALARALVGMEVVSDLQDAETDYAIVTNFSMWWFLKRSDDRVQLDQDAINFDHLARVAGKINAMLADGASGASP